jgi:hypothetical protein
VVLETAGKDAQDKNPVYMILPSSGTVGDGNSLSDHFDPCIIGPANFFLTVPGVTANTNLTSANFSNVQIGFGTSPDTTLLATSTPNLIPAPSAVVLQSIGGICLLAALSAIFLHRREQFFAGFRTFCES